MLPDFADSTRATVKRWSQCTWWCWVLPDNKQTERLEGILESQCTWWCWVLPDPSACCPLSRLGKRAPDRHWPESALGPCSTSSIEADFAQFSQGSPPTGLQGLRATRCRRGHADPGGRAVFFGYQCADVGREPGSPGSQTAGGMWSCGGRGASSNEGARGFPPSSVRLARTVGTPL